MNKNIRYNDDINTSGAPNIQTEKVKNHNHSSLARLGEKQGSALDQYSRLVVRFLILGQYL